MKLTTLLAALALAFGCSSKTEHKPVDPHVLEMHVVDDNTQFMKTVYRHADEDSQASAMHVKADVDSWRPDGRQMFTDFYLTGPDRVTLEKYVAQFPIPDDHVMGYELVKPGLWRTYYLKRAIEIDASGIAKATTSHDRYTERPAVMLDFTDKAKQHFGELTTQIVGHKLATVVNGTVKSAPIINSAIKGGHAEITMGGTDVEQMEHDAIALADALNGRTPQ